MQLFPRARRGCYVEGPPGAGRQAMRLKKIEVLGFKSFADRQIVVVDDHVTSVIGPNGCGKSNIVDAIRWCMGEQSAKHLRGSGMADVIFAGCTSRGPAGMAEVTLTLENQGDVVAPHLDYPEIAITRRLYADGTSEYLINKVPSRLRDINELLLGTGVGTKGYSIIEQGQVGRIVSSKPEERRHIIDEAAGITRFKAQKAAATRKIDATRQNLLRVHDVIAELESRLSTLRRQAQKAERYKRYKDELRDLDLWTAAHKYLELQTTGGVLEQRRADLSVQIDDLRAALSARDTESETKRTELTQVERELSERQQRVYDLDNRIRLLEAENDYRKREREGLVQSGTQARAEAESGGRTLEHTLQELQEVEQQRQALGVDEGPDSQRHAVEQRVTAHREVEQALVQAQGQLESARVEVGERRSSLAGHEARLSSQRESVQRASAREEDRGQALLDVQGKLRRVELERDQSRSRVQESGERLQRLQERRAELDRQRTSLREQVAAAEVELDTKRAEVHRHRSRLQSLEEIQNRYRSCHSGVQVVMEHAQELSSQVSTDGSVTEGGRSAQPVYGILADYVSAPAHLETAVSAVLGDRLEAVVVDAPAVGARGVELLKREQEGRTTFVPRHGRVSGPDPAKVSTLTEGTLIGWSPPSPMQGSTPNAGAGVGTEGTSPFEIVDLSGERQASEPSGDPESVVGAPQPGQAGEAVLGRTRPVEPSVEDALLEQAGVVGRLGELVKVSGELAPLGRALLGDAVVVENLSRALELWDRFGPSATLVTLDGDRLEPTGVVVGGSPTALNSALLQQKREIRELTEILAELDESFEQARGRHLGLASQLRDVEQARDRSETEVLEAEKARVQALGESERLDEDAERLEREQSAISSELESIRQELSERRRGIEELEEAIGQARSRIEELEENTGQTQARIEELTRERDAQAAALTEAKVELAKWQQQSDALSATHERLLRQAESERQRIGRLEETARAAEQRIAELDETTEAASTERDQLLSDSKEATTQVHESRERFDRLRLEIDELEVSMRTLRGDLEDRRDRLGEVELGLKEINLEREHLIGDIAERFDLQVGDILIDFHDRRLAGKEERDRQKELKRILSRMGEVNLTAIEEFEEVSNRYEYLTTQRADLENAIEQLQEAIDKINRTTRDLFRETFDAVNERFQQLFPRLFGGGHAELKMTDPSDLLTTGVEIEARPPGKQPRTLDLLSGGEKALTAVSLIFAIFLIKPSPFCLLDEVDAPLDDANVARFCGLVRELASNTQFIIITHNKVTMETADRLYGVTMEQRGISKLVSVNLRRAVELAHN